jgi:hypothetical protein
LSISVTFLRLRISTVCRYWPGNQGAGNVRQYQLTHD